MIKNTPALKTRLLPSKATEFLTGVQLGSEAYPSFHLKLYFLQEKLLFSNLNKCKLHQEILDGEVWIPEEKLDLVQEAINKISSKNPPTF